MNTILIGKAEEIDLVQPKVREMLSNPGFYIGGDTKNPEMNVPLVSNDGRVFSMEVDQELDPERFLDTLTLKGPYRIDHEPVAEETFVSDVSRFTEAVGCTTDRFNVRQTAMYIGLQLEEMSEKLEALGWEGIKHTGGSFTDMIIAMRRASHQFKCGEMDVAIEDADREAMLDADIDLAWVTVGSALSQGADVLGAMREVARANLDKIGPDGSVIKDENGKVKKPTGWRGPDISPYVIRHTAAPAVVSYPMGSLGEEVQP